MGLTSGLCFVGGVPAFQITAEGPRFKLRLRLWSGWVLLHSDRDLCTEASLSLSGALEIWGARDRLGEIVEALRGYRGEAVQGTVEALQEQQRRGDAMRGKWRVLLDDLNRLSGS